MTHMSNPEKQTRQRSVADRRPNPVDVHIGNRLRQRRMLIGLSQEDLANEVGCAFQQIQKYECAVNRVSTARLWAMAVALQCSVSFFYEGMAAAPGEDTAAAPDRSALATRGETLKLVRAYNTIKDHKTRRQIFELAHVLGRSPAPGDQPGSSEGEFAAV